MQESFWPNGAIRQALDVAISDPAVKRVVLEVEDRELNLTVNVEVRPASLADGHGHFTRPILVESNHHRLPQPSLTVERAVPEAEPVKQRRPRSPSWSQSFFYQKYALAEHEMASPLEVAKMAARMDLAEQTFRHYYFGGPPNGRYKTPGLGWGPTPGCRAIGE